MNFARENDIERIVVHSTGKIASHKCYINSFLFSKFGYKYVLITPSRGKGDDFNPDESKSKYYLKNNNDVFNNILNYDHDYYLEFDDIEHN
jgi:hypothetical protein